LPFREAHSDPKKHWGSRSPLEEMSVYKNLPG
jgi:hypothetical protein